MAFNRKDFKTFEEVVTFISGANSALKLASIVAKEPLKEPKIIKDSVSYALLEHHKIEYYLVLNGLFGVDYSFVNIRDKFLIDYGITTSILKLPSGAYRLSATLVRNALRISIANYEIEENQAFILGDSMMKTDIGTYRLEDMRTFLSIAVLLLSA